MQNKTKHLFRVLVLSFFIYLLSNSLTAQELAHLDKRFLFEDVFSMFPGETGFVKNSSISFFYSIPYNLKDLSTRSLNISIPAGKFFSIETFFSDFGTDKYSEEKIGISIGKKILTHLAFGISLTGNRLSIRNYPNKTEENIGFGTTFKNNRLIFSFCHVLKNGGMDKPVSYFESGAALSKRLHLYLLLKKENDFPVQKILTIFFRENLLSFDGGFGDNPSYYSLGFCYRIMRYRFSFKYKEDMNLGKSQFFCFYILI
ncbi:hypothetical protein ACFL4T_09050 [candidate division KSB1 bacterium]